MRKNLLTLTLAASLLAPGAALAGSPVRGTRGSGPASSAAQRESAKDAELKKKEETKVPERDLAGDITRKKKDKVVEKPALEYDQFRLGVELQVASKRHEQIETLAKIIQLGPNPAEAPDLTFRLGELYWEESKYFFFEANRKDDDILRARAEKNQAKEKQAEAEKKDILKKSDQYQNAAIEQYRTIVKKYPKYQRMDEVLFFLGHNMWESGKEKEAVTVYSKLLKDYPKSKYQPDAWVAVGQYYFNGSKGKRDDLERALAAFKKAESFTDSKVYGYAIYMQGWAYVNLGDHKTAMDKFKAVIYYGELQGKTDSRATSLSREARKDYVVAYSHVGDVMSAKADFQKVGGDENWWNMMKGLANLYYEDGKDKEATIVYNMLIRERPLSPDAPFFQGRIVDCVMRVGNKKVTVNQVRELVRIIQEVEKAGVVKKDEDKKAFQDARDLAERTMSNLAVTWHNEAKKTRDEQVFFLASEVYQDYLEIFPDTAKAYDLRFFFAELLNDNLNKYDRAAEEYTKVLLQDIAKMEEGNPKPEKGKEPPPPDIKKAGRWRPNAAYNAILAYDEVVKKVDQTEQKPAGDPRAKLPIPPQKKALLVACDRYTRYVPEGDKRVEILYKAAKILNDYNYFENANPLFAKIALEHPEHELAEYSANLVLDSYNLLEDWQNLNNWARKFYNSAKLAGKTSQDGKGKLKDQFAQVLEQSAFKLVKLLEDKTDFAGAGQAYLTFVDEFPKTSLADLALFNAAIDFFKAKQIDKAIEIRSRIISAYPASKYVPQCVFANAEDYEAIGDFEQAAHFYELYGQAWAKEKGGGAKGKPAAKKGKAAAKKDDDKKPAEGAKYEEGKAQIAFFNAATLRQGLTQFNEAMRNCNTYLELWPNAKDAEEIFLFIGTLYEKAGKPAKAMSHLEEYEKQYGVRDPDKMLTAEARIAKIYEKMGNTKGANRTYDRVLDYYEKKMSKAQRAKLGPAAIEAVAKATYLSTEVPFIIYSRIAIPQDERKLKSTIEAKKKSLDELEGLYKKVVGFKAADPALCSLYKIGLLYRNFAEVLTTAPIPEMPFPKQLNQIKHLWNVPWKKWPKDYREAIPEADLDNIKQQVQAAKEQFEQEYRNQLMQVAAPAEDKAAEAFATAVAASRETKIYNDCAQKSLELLSEKYKPSEFPKVTEQLVELKSGVEKAEGNGLLASVQPIPVVARQPEAKKAALEDPPPTFGSEHGTDAPKKKVAPKSEEPEGPPSEEAAAPPPPRAADPAPKSSEPEDPDLLK